ncbi:TPA: hypothetical protein DHT42_00760 [Candidatus Nomurabacteria bacterium]|nr:hypothetical protein [Candidatus Nomurabacteria bacterium]
MFIPEGRYEERDDDVLSREFQKAFVYVNPTKSDKYISFGGSYYYLTEDGVKSTNKISSTTLKPNRAIILFKDCSNGECNVVNNTTIWNTFAEINRRVSNNLANALSAFWSAFGTFFMGVFGD